MRCVDVLDEMKNENEVAFLEKPVILIGAGGQALVLAECLQLLHVDVLGMIDKNPLGGGQNTL